jgi:dynein heavy chain
VLDENFVLCSANGERIKLPPSVSMLFEVEDLAAASPGTVSRCGMVFVPTGMVSPRSVAQSYLRRVLARCDVEVVAAAIQHCDMIEPTVHFLQTEGFLGCVDAGDAQLAINFCNILNALFLMHEGRLDSDTDKRVDALLELLPMFAGFSFCWGLCGAQSEASQEKIDEFARTEFGDVFAAFPRDATVFEFVLDFNERRLVRWGSVVPAFSPAFAKPLASVFIPTTEATVLEHLLSLSSLGRFHLLAVGSEGVGKSAALDLYIGNLDRDRFTSASTALSSSTSASKMRMFFESKLDRVRQRELGAPPGRTCVVVIDDLSMPKRDEVGSHPPLEFLRQILDKGGFYDQAKFFFKEVVNTQLLCACAPSGLAHAAVSKRFLRHFFTVNIRDISSISLRTILTQMCKTRIHLFSFDPTLIDSLVEATVSLCSRVGSTLLPTPSRPHYRFSMREMSRVFQGVLTAHPTGITDRTSLTNLWAHESCRVFRDRLIDGSDRSTFDKILAETSTQYMRPTAVGSVEIPFHTLSFGDFYLGRAEAKLSRQYVKCSLDDDGLTQCIEDFHAQYCMETSSTPDLIVFPQAARHINRICRAMRLQCSSVRKHCKARPASSRWFFP